ncbi:MAG: TrmH family RNA methyltransferase, partial [Chloroflexota bacterium]
HPSTLRASLGTAFTVPIAHTTVADFDQWRQEQNIFLLGTSANAEISYQQFKATGPTGLLLGNEREGLIAEFAAMADQMVTIPMQGQASSLNLAVAAGIMMFALQP